MISIIIGILFLIQTDLTAIGILFIIGGILNIFKGLYNLGTEAQKKASKSSATLDEIINAPEEESHE